MLSQAHYLHRSQHLRPGMLSAHSTLQIPGHGQFWGPARVLSPSGARPRHGITRTV